MMRRTQTFLKVSPFFLYLKDQSQAGKLSGVRAPAAKAAKQYRKLSANEKASLVQRAKSMTFASSTAYRRLAKRELADKSVPVAQRQAQLRKKWAAVKKSQKKTKAPKAARAAKPKSAKSKVKKAAKTVKKAKNSKKSKKASK